MYSWYNYNTIISPRAALTAGGMIAPLKEVTMSPIVPQDAKKEARKQYLRDYYQAHKEDWAKRAQVRRPRRLAEMRDWYARKCQDPAFVEQERKRDRARRKLNPAGCRVYCQRRRAYRKGAAGRFTKAEWMGLCFRYGNRCLACGGQKKLTVDHVIPLSQGGTNDIGNIQPLCFSCNASKGTKTIDYRSILES